MNLPNKLTLLRIALVPVYLILQSLNAQWVHWIALIVFFVAAMTDLIDGRLARARGLVTNFGKFMDPIADKLLVIPAAVLMVAQGQLMPVWMCIVWVAREFVVSGLRMVAVERGLVIPAGMWGKIKTVLQMIALMMLTVNLPGLRVLTTIVLYAATLLTLVSAVLYVWEGRAVLRESPASNKGAGL